MSGYRNSALPADLLPPLDRWPSRETALSLIAAIEGGQAGDYRDLERITGVQDAAQVIGWCFSIYGYSALSPRVVATWLAAGTMSRAPRAPDASPPPSTPETEPFSPQRLSYGFNK